MSISDNQIRFVGIKKAHRSAIAMVASKKMILNWQGNYRLMAKNEKGLTISSDAPSPFGDEDSALSPMESVLASLAACSSIYIISILNEQKQKISAFSVEIQTERNEEPLRVFTKIHLMYIIKGKEVSKDVMNKAVAEAEGNYWSVGTMLKKAVHISSSYGYKSKLLSIFVKLRL